MPDDRRRFLQKACMLAGAFSLNNLFNQLYAADIEQANKKVAGLSAEKIATDEDFGQQFNRHILLIQIL